jgi:hypothetical protein
MSLLPVFSYILPRVVMMAIHMLTMRTGAECHKVGFADKSLSMETVMEDFISSLEAEGFPGEIETEAKG